MRNLHYISSFITAIRLKCWILHTDTQKLDDFDTVIGWRDSGQSADHEELRRLWIEVVMIRSRLVLAGVILAVSVAVKRPDFDFPLLYNNSNYHLNFCHIFSLQCFAVNFRSSSQNRHTSQSCQPSTKNQEGEEGQRKKHTRVPELDRVMELRKKPSMILELWWMWHLKMEFLLFCHGPLS
ncbi:hypothetical protein TSUD_368060 [Trifolium subterraneum]|uniref:Uncharacterized protein n=1 Tax=Trifolium subterraneum TaxID=3900 RepID=A0A2Z6LMA3_TRISU|nr:hypothetical protein TSUD_368060 [Trifolium subterraneum]